MGRSRPAMRRGAPSDDWGENLKIPMFYVYILLENNGMLYTGFSSDLRQRVKDHSAGKVESTRDRRPLKLVHYEAYVKESDARRREKYLKTSEGKRFLKQQIRDLLEELDL
ncbi:MAG: GIY-YIG nuclease family protein [Lentisphaerae bacterium]|nr:GIY-YIG nuclease family protein [Lentisphaerota bacterium]